MLLGFANWDTLPTEAAVKAEAKQEASWRQSGLSLNKTKEKGNASPQHDTKFVFNLQKSLPGLVGHRSWCAMGWGEGEVRPRSCKLLNCSNLPVMASAQSGGWTHAMHSSTFGSELGGKRRWNRCVHVPTLLKRFTALVRWLLQRLLPATANTRATIKGNGTFQLANLPP